jgi:hypothetical protein
MSAPNAWKSVCAAAMMSTVSLLASASSAEEVAAPKESAGADAPAVSHVVAGEKEGTLHLHLDSSALYGIGGQSFLGALARGLAGVTAWHGGNASGSADVGLALAYHNEPTWLAPWLANGQISGAAHRVQLLLVAGHTFYVLESRALAIGLHGQGGWNHWISSYSLEYPAEGVSGKATIARDHFVLGGQLTASLRLIDHLGIQIVAGGPIPIESSYVVSMFHVGVGLTVDVF